MDKIKLYICNCGWWGKSLPFVTKIEGNVKGEGQGCPDCKNFQNSKNFTIKEVPAKAPDSDLPFMALMDHPVKGLIPLYGVIGGKDGFGIPDENGDYSYYKFDTGEWGEFNGE